MYDLKIFSSFHRMPSNIIIVPLMYRNFLVLYNMIYFYFCLCFLFFWRHIQFLKSLLTPKSWSALPPSPPHSPPPSLSTHKYMLYSPVWPQILISPSASASQVLCAWDTMLTLLCFLKEAWLFGDLHLSLTHIYLLLVAVRNMIQSQASECIDLVFPTLSIDAHFCYVSPFTFDREQQMYMDVFISGLPVWVPWFMWLCLL